MVEMNFKEKLSDAQKIIKTWEKRYLTPLGRITVVKTFILSKFNHLFLALPTPSLQWQKTLDHLCYKFIWSNKPDKIARNVISLEKTLGGMKMLDISLFEMCLKGTWYRKLLRQPHSLWHKLFQESFTKDLDKLTKLGPEFILQVSKDISNKFWFNVFKSAYEILQNQPTHKIEQILTTPLWYNKKLSKEHLFIPDWYNKGIVFISDILDSQNGSDIMPLEKLETLYGITEKKFLHYLRVKGLCKQFLKNNNYNKNNFIRPNIPNHIKILYNSNKGARDLYKYAYNNRSNTHSMKEKWNLDLNISIDNQTWRDIFKTCYFTTHDNSLIWFQLRIIYRIHGTNYYLNKNRTLFNPFLS